jgi:hypothetical protein
MSYSGRNVKPIAHFHLTLEFTIHGGLSVGTLYVYIFMAWCGKLYVLVYVRVYQNKFNLSQSSIVPLIFYSQTLLTANKSLTLILNSRFRTFLF